MVWLMNLNGLTECEVKFKMANEKQYVIMFPYVLIQLTNHKLR